ncbi:Uncharacterized metal-binding protein YceD, DUF177 family [Limimonas halophila]|uniref:Uncharacterized metal-binding protein YceD, DUF177 family n=1 Tax=Limimonas halophila TaxID=1082479 RepID=A0A1G7NV36_9PROT|nr:DUF177 domain-containing protein [Limimonas halophila]SDF77905.1 Uncharacterized metal-binding protein YceD, DUF177 family [Limimonas halophila]
MTLAPDGTTEFSRPLRLDRLSAGTFDADYEASASETAALATRFDLPGIQSLSGSLRVRRPGNGPLIRVEGRVRAEVTQVCVVTLEEVANRIEESFVQLYTTAPHPEDSEVFVSPDDEDTPEPLTGNSLDLGEILAEQLALALDPYPRAPGAEFGTASAETSPDEERNPFAKLAELRWRH